MTTEQFILLALFQSLWQAPLISGATWVVLRIYNEAPARTRHGIYYVALSACVVFPTLTSVQAAPLNIPEIFSESR